MTGPAAWMALAGGGLGLGLTLIIAGSVRTERHAISRRLADRSSIFAAGRSGPSAGSSGGTASGLVRWRRVSLGVVAAVGAVAVTGWPVAAGMAVAGVWWLPRVLGPDRELGAAVARIEAVAGWAEQLRDTLAAAAGLEQAITATAATAPLVVRPAVAAVAARIKAGERLPVALRQAAQEIADPTGDLVIAALTLASQQQARQLGDLLAALAAAAREVAAGRMRTAVARARVRTSVRVIVGATLAFSSGLVLLNSPYLTPYGTLEGQIVLVGVAGMFALAFGWLAHIGRPEPTIRLIAPPTDDTP
ncbi:type II secretion system F family protein [Pseudonocardia sp. TRM90224]|uniref:type II secretion system F family protein n=1 Tax=Pseudonocardia sp. TRM90224 TaxID=2812678 RepID=UPI001E434C6F|nr:type II secretion system F family protein [Pseudonocardia sp. TRM90224]